jgi:tyrosyl-DNA phosphodiesterase 2
VFLQEVVQRSETLLKEALAGRYHFSSGYSGCEYYTLVLIKKKTCRFHSAEITRFENSTMGRNLLQVKLSYKNVDVCAMTAHLESTGDFAKQRIQQLQKALKIVSELDPKCVVFFGGDLNLRDSEISGIGGLPKGVHDVWESTGKRKECAYTWDTLRNSNLVMNGKYKPRCRFDRLYYRGANETQASNRSDSQESLTLMPVYFELEGLERLKSCNRFCSDHWAIQAYCQLEPLAC